MTQFETKFLRHFPQQGASHPLPCIPSAPGADGWSWVTTRVLSLPSSAFQEGFIGNLICSHWFGPVPALNEKWPISRFISPSKFMGSAWQFSNQALTKKPSTGWIHNPKETQLLSPVLLHWHHCRESKFCLFSVSVAETLLPTPERKTHFADHLDAW